ncbi:MAG: transposase [Saprospiraceae bacterium]
MSNKYKIRDQRGLNFLTLTVVGWIDIFSRKKYRDLMIDSLKFCQKKKGLNIYGYVIMTNHIHLIASAEGEQTLSEVLGNFKSFTATSIMKDLPESNESRREWMMYLFGYFAKKNKRRTEHQFWQTKNHPIDLYSVKAIRQKLNYIHQNPVRAGWVEYPQHYIYSSASNYLEEGKGILEVVILESFYDFLK